jgi:hypothetical protein
MKKVFIITLACLTVLAAGLYLFRAPLLEVAANQLTADMFVTADDGSFDPGTAVGQPFPAIHADHAGETVRDVMQFAGPHGLIFVANRSADW